MARRRFSRSKRAPMRPFSPAEDAELIQMMRCGLASDFYRLGLPERELSDILERRLQLREAGIARLAPLI